ncbi:MAG: competence/damage-inducible protein A [Gammaproteobacteria bacterium]|nr:competence/damage-inducible protein A [Gammaproteobacteria bacterium]
MKAKRQRRVAIISTGDELVQGRTVDTNATYIADRLGAIGIEAQSIVTVGDYPEQIEWAWHHSLARADIVIATGGLGPTADDRTSETLAHVADAELYLDEEQAQRIRRFFEVLKRPMPENNLKQARFPVGAEIIPNELGTAPGYRLAVPQGQRRPIAVVLPGVPREMKAMLDTQVIPWILSQSEDDRSIVSRTFQTFGMSESALDEALMGAIDPDEARLSFRASFPQVSVRIAVIGKQSEAEHKLEALSEIVRARLGDAVVAEGDVTMEQVVGELLKRHKQTLATAESCSGGLIGNRITNVAGSSEYYLGGVIAYSNELKRKTLSVSPETLSRFGAVSEETACEMALGVRNLSQASLGIATTGIAGPDGGTKEKPVGTVTIALAADGLGSTNVRARSYQLWGNRDWIKILTSQVALDWVRRHLLGRDPLASDFGLRGSRWQSRS